MDNATKYTVLDRLVNDIASTRGDNDVWYGDYHRTPRILKAGSSEEAEETLQEVYRQVRERLGPDRAEEVRIIKCRSPRPGMEYDLDKGHQTAVLEGAGQPDPERWEDRIYNGEEWQSPRILLFSNADAIAEIGEPTDPKRWMHSNVLRCLTDYTRVGTVFFGTNKLYRMSFADSGTTARVKHYDLAKERGKT